MSKTLTFDATRVATSVMGRYIYTDIETDFPGEVLGNFTPKEIVEFYGESNLEDLYEILKEKFD